MGCAEVPQSLVYIPSRNGVSTLAAASAAAVRGGERVRVRGTELVRAAQLGCFQLRRWIARLPVRFAVPHHEEKSSGDGRDRMVWSGSGGLRACHLAAGGDGLEQRSTC